MPEYLENHQKQYLHTLYESLLYKDIIVRHRLPQAQPIKELVYYLASNNTKLFTYNSLRKLLSIASPTTVAEYCQYLENSYLCFSLSQFSYSVKKRLHFAKKIYFIDPALVESVGFRFTHDYGRTLENIVFLQLARQNKEIYFHQDKLECDFIIRDGYHIVQAIQVSANLSNPATKNREFSGLLEALSTYGLEEGLIITEDESGEERVNHQNKLYRIHWLPCWQWLLAMEKHPTHPPER